MRWLPPILAVLFAACDGDPAPAGTPTPAPVAAPDAAAAAAHADLDVPQLAAHLLSGTATAVERSTAGARADATVAAVLHAASRGTPQQQGRAPAVLAALGTPALPGLAAALQNPDPTQRRLAALTLLQLGDRLHADGTASTVLPALLAASNDPDPAVRAAAELAAKRASGDTTDLDKSRAEHDAALRGGR